MNSLNNKMNNFSIYDVRKVARSAQNSIFQSNSSPIELMIRKSTNTDSWGPSTKQLEEISNQLVFESDIEGVFDIIFNRISEYLGATNKFIKKKQSFYNKAVHYVNSGNEWRIISKSLKLLEFLILHSGGDDAIQIIQGYKGLLKKVLDAYEYEGSISEIVTTLELERKEHGKVITKQVQEILKLLEDKNYRDKECAKALKTSNLESVGNNAIVFKNRNGDDDLMMRGNYKSKDMDSSKVQNSNAKDEIRNQLGHIIYTKKKLPGQYSGDFGGEQLYDDFDDNDGYQPYDDTYHDVDVGEKVNKGFKDEVDDKEEEDDWGDFEQDDDEDDEFGDFQPTPKTPQIDEFKPKSKDHESLLLSFDDEPNTPTNPPTSSAFDSFLTTLNSPDTSKQSTKKIDTSTKPKNGDTFADLFQTAKNVH